MSRFGNASHAAWTNQLLWALCLVAWSEHTCHIRVAAVVLHFNQTLPISLHHVVGTHYPWSGYGLAPGGTIEINLTFSPPPQDATCLILNEDQNEALVEKIRYAQTLGISDGNHDLWVITLEPPQSTWRSNLPSEAKGVITVETARPEPFYVVIILASYYDDFVQTPVLVQGHISLANPGGEHLPWEEIQMPFAQLTLLCLYGVLAFCLVVSVMWFWSARSKLHLLMLAAALAQMVAHYASYMHLQYRSRTGDTANSVGSLGVVVLEEVAHSMQLCLCYAIGLGWKIVRLYMRSGHTAWFAMVIMLSVALSALYWACRNHLGQIGFFCAYFIMVQYTMRCFCYLIVVCAVNCNIFILQRQIIDARPGPESGELYARASAYGCFRFLFLLHVVIAINRPFDHGGYPRQRFYWEEEWMVKFLCGVMEWGVLFAITMLFSPLGLRAMRVFKLADFVDSDSSNSDGDEARPLAPTSLVGPLL